jgi:hypothetical protein
MAVHDIDLRGDVLEETELRHIVFLITNECMAMGESTSLHILA